MDRGLISWVVVLRFATVAKQGRDVVWRRGHKRGGCRDARGDRIERGRLLVAERHDELLADLLDREHVILRAAELAIEPVRQCIAHRLFVEPKLVLSDQHQSISASTTIATSPTIVCVVPGRHTL